MERLILFLSYSNPLYDGRLRELMKISQLLGKTTFLLRHEENYINELINVKLYKGHRGLVGYVGFVFWVLYHAKRTNYSCVFIDNDLVALPALLIKLFKPKATLIFDMRELLAVCRVEGFFSKIIAKLVRMLIKKADVVICANAQRALIVKERCRLDYLPLVYENVHKLSGSDSDILPWGDEFLKELQTKDKYTIIATDGFQESRGTKKLLESIRMVKKPIRLIIVGLKNLKDKESIEKIISECQLSEIYTFGILNEPQLKKAIELSDIGVVSYGKQDENNIYCASGKLYEFAFEGKPIIASTNPPLLEKCETYGIGVARESFADAIEECVMNYDYYKRNMERFANDIDVEENNIKLLHQIQERLVKKEKCSL